MRMQEEAQVKLTCKKRVNYKLGCILICKTQASTHMHTTTQFRVNKHILADGAYVNAYECALESYEDEHNDDKLS